MSKLTALTSCCLVYLFGCAPSTGGEPSDEGWDQLDIGKGDGSSASSYGALALATVPAQLEVVRVGLELVDDDVLPHETKQLRKEIGKLRDFVDLFAFAYKPGKHGDKWKDVRDELDVGYETMGHFKDLFDVQDVVDPTDAVYDEDEVAELRDELRGWSDVYAASEHQQELSAYLGAPSSTKLHDRPKDDQPRFYWQEAGLEPDAKLSGLKNLARLQRELLDEASRDLADVPEIGKLTKASNAVAFHDFRKRVRSIEKLATYFPQMTKPNDSEQAAELLEVIIEAVDRYGTLNDQIVRFERAKDDDDDDRADELEDAIDEEFEVLIEWQEDVDLDEVLEDLRSTVRK